MVWITVMKLCKRYSLNLFSTVIKVSEDASCVSGTSAYLRENDLLTLWDLLHGMMLPSGNDAGYLLAEYFGKLMKKSGQTRVDLKNKSKVSKTKSEEDNEKVDEVDNNSETSK